ncbi:MAG: M48 family metalloprotease [Rhodobiaceae bacterium]|nr:M48 family metalloprotease [Rhodobiaceae bacterium]
MALLALGACATTLPDGTVALSPIPASDKKIGEREHPRVVAAYGGAYESPRMQAYLENIVSELAAETGTDLDYKITILNSPSLNAFSLPGGYLYVTRGLLALANDDAEVATVLSHEMAHVVRRHAISREEQANAAATVSRVISDVVSDPVAGAQALALTQRGLAQFSRVQEQEADLLGIHMAAEAGFDPAAAARFLNSLERQTTLHSHVLNQQYDSGRVDLFSSHPTTPERISAAQAAAAAEKQRGHRDRAAYLAALSGTLYGDDPREGYVRERTFIHPVLGLTFSLPDGFGLENTPRAVVGIDSAGDIIRFDGITLPRETPLADHLTRGTVRSGTVGPVSEVQINGFQVAIADISAGEWVFRVALIRARGNDVYRFIMAVKEMTPERSATFEEAIRSFRFITPAEAALARPLRVAVVEVKRGDTIASLSGRMALSDNKQERFMVLNGLTGASDLRPGMQVKLIVE